APGRAGGSGTRVGISSHSLRHEQCAGPAGALRMAARRNDRSRREEPRRLRQGALTGRQTRVRSGMGLRVVQVSLFLVAAISIFGGTLQMYLGEPQVSPRLDNVHRFMAG